LPKPPERCFAKNVATHSVGQLEKKANVIKVSEFALVNRGLGRILSTLLALNVDRSLRRRLKRVSAEAGRRKHWLSKANGLKIRNHQPQPVFSTSKRQTSNLEGTLGLESNILGHYSHDLFIRETADRGPVTGTLSVSDLPSSVS
jgi:hypothetical protein